jgi:hypothetical protein
MMTDGFDVRAKQRRWHGAVGSIRSTDREMKGMFAIFRDDF